MASETTLTPPALAILSRNFIVDAATTEIVGRAVGGASPPVTVRVECNGAFAGAPKVGEDGRWALAVPLSVGDNTITVTATNQAGYETVAEVLVMRLVTDRTQADAARVKQLSAKDWAKMTDAERLEWLYGYADDILRWRDGEVLSCTDGVLYFYAEEGSHKGAYNDVDMARVEEAAGYLSDLLIDLPVALREYAESIGVAWDADYDVPYDPDKYGIETKTDWAVTDIPDKAQLDRYLGNVALLASAIVLESALPDSMNNLTYSDANAIEAALIALNDSIGKLQRQREEQLENVRKSFRRSGQFTFWSGTLPLPV